MLKTKRLIEGTPHGFVIKQIKIDEPGGSADPFDPQTPPLERGNTDISRKE